MNQNQEFIKLDEDKRRKVSEKIAKILKEKCGYDVTDELDNFLNDNSIYEKIQNATKYLKQVKGASDNYKFMTELETMNGNKLFHNGQVYINFKPNDNDIDTYIYNKKEIEKLRTQKGYYASIQQFLKKAYETTYKHYTIENISDLYGNENSVDYLSGYVSSRSDLPNVNPALNEIMSYNKNIWEITRAHVEAKKYKNIVGLFVPMIYEKIGTADNDAYIKIKDEIKEEIKNEFPDLENQYNKLFDDTNLLDSSADNFIAEAFAYSKSEYDTDINKQILKEYGFDENTKYTKVFKKGGKTVSFDEVKADFIKNGKKSDEYRLDDVDPNLLKDAKDTEERIFFEGKIEELKIRLKDFKNNIPTYDEALINQLEKLLNEYKNVEKDIPVDFDFKDKEIRLKTNELILEFKKNHELELEKIDASIKEDDDLMINKTRKRALEEKILTENFIEAKKEKEREEINKQKILDEQEKIFENSINEELEKYYNEQNKKYAKTSFSSMATETENLINEINKLPENVPAILEKLRNSRAKKSTLIKNYDNVKFKNLSKEQITKMMFLFGKNYEKIDNYNRFGKFKKWWYKKSLDKLRTQNEELKNTFKSLGVSGYAPGIYSITDFKNSFKIYGTSLKNRNSNLEDHCNFVKKNLENAESFEQKYDEKIEAINKDVVANFSEIKTIAFTYLNEYANKYFDVNEDDPHYNFVKSIKENKSIETKFFENKVEIIETFDTIMADKFKNDPNLASNFTKRFKDFVEKDKELQAELAEITEEKAKATEAAENGKKYNPKPSLIGERLKKQEAKIENEKEKAEVIEANDKKKDLRKEEIIM